MLMISINDYDISIFAYYCFNILMNILFFIVNIFITVNIIGAEIKTLFIIIKFTQKLST